MRHALALLFLLPACTTENASMSRSRVESAAATEPTGRLETATFALG